MNIPESPTTSRVDSGLVPALIPTSLADTSTNKTPLSTLRSSAILTVLFRFVVSAIIIYYGIDLIKFW